MSKKQQQQQQPQDTRATGTVRVTLVRSVIGRPKDQAETVRSLRLRRLHQTAEHPDTPAVRGMINKVHHLVVVDDTEK